MGAEEHIGAGQNSEPSTCRNEKQGSQQRCKIDPSLARQST